MTRPRGFIAIDANQVKGIAILQPKRSPEIANLPSTAEQGLPDFDVMRPTGYPPPSPLTMRFSRHTIGVAVAWSSIALAQQPEPVRRIGVLGDDPSTTVAPGKMT